MTTKLHTQWIVGFVDGEGCFRASIIKNATMQMGYQIQMEFIVTQHKRDVQVLYALKKFFQCGQVSVLKNKEATNCYRFRVRKFDHLLEIIIPFFEQHHLKTKKTIEFKRFRKLCLLLKEKTHLTPKGFEKCIGLAKTIPFDHTIEMNEILIKVESNS